MLEGAMLIWFILTGLSVAFVVWDSLVNGVTSWVQRLAWILVTIYTGPIGAFMYVLGCRRPFPGGHDRYTAAGWKQGLNSEVHCLAGDATGIIVAASVVPALALTNGWDVLIEYAAGFVFGLFIFQALMMLSMYDGNYIRAVRKTFFAETVSMNMVMTGMIPVMVVLAARWPHSMDPLEPAFWFRMSLASIAGGLIAFPINHWLVKSHLKHGCMTLPGADGPAPALGHRSPEPQPVHLTTGNGKTGREMHTYPMAGHGGPDPADSQKTTSRPDPSDTWSGHDMAAHKAEAHAMSDRGSDRGMEGGKYMRSRSVHSGSQQSGAPDQDPGYGIRKAPDKESHDHGAQMTHSVDHALQTDAMPGGHTGHGDAHGDHGMAMRELSLGASLAWIIGTSAVLLVTVWLTAQRVPISFT